MKTILVPIDVKNPEGLKKAIETAAGLARQHEAKLLAVWVVPRFEHNLNVFPEDHRPELEAYVKEAFPDDVDTEPVLRAGSVVREICAEAKERKADVIVMASHNPRASDMLLGSNAASVVLHAPTSVYIVR